MSQWSRFDSDAAIRGGIPICWPWFAAGVRGAAQPLHGFARLAEWRLVEVRAEAEAVTATYLLIDAWPAKFDHPYRLTYQVSFGESFSARLTVRNTGTRRFTFEAALHTYFRVGDVRQVSLVGLDGAQYLDRVAGHVVGPHQQHGEVRIEAETDRIYHLAGPIDLVDPVLGRRIGLRRTGYVDAVVWNPWIDKSRVTPDLGDDEWQTMVCVEAANVAEHAVTLNSGKEHVMELRIEVDRLTP
jgi:glucose-6-phosphate 1-epimerase